MMGHFENPLADAKEFWLPEEESGRAAPPSGPVYAATVAFADAEDGVHHEWWRLGEHGLSTLLEFAGPVNEGTRDVHLGFVSPPTATS